MIARLSFVAFFFAAAPVAARANGLPALLQLGEDGKGLFGRVETFAENA